MPPFYELVPTASGASGSCVERNAPAVIPGKTPAVVPETPVVVSVSASSSVNPVAPVVAPGATSLAAPVIIADAPGSPAVAPAVEEGAVQVPAATAVAAIPVPENATVGDEEENNDGNEDQDSSSNDDAGEDAGAIPVPENVTGGDEEEENNDGDEDQDSGGDDDDAPAAAPAVAPVFQLPAPAAAPAAAPVFQLPQAPVQLPQAPAFNHGNQWMVNFATQLTNQGIHDFDEDDDGFIFRSTYTAARRGCGKDAFIFIELNRILLVLKVSVVSSFHRGKDV